MTKHYLGSITENIMGYEFSAQFLFTAETEEEREQTLSGIESDFRPDTGGEIIQDEATWQEISASDFEVLRQYISVLG